MAKGDSPKRLEQRRQAQARYKKKYPDKAYSEAHKQKQREYWRSKAGADIHSTTRPQPSHCEVCGNAASGKTMHWDHNHTTGKFRGWLCVKCNASIGFAKESAIILRALASYVDRDGN